MPNAPPLLLWAPSRLVRELRAFCVPELQSQHQAAAQRAAAADHGPPPMRLSTADLDGGWLAEVDGSPNSEMVLKAARKCTLLTAAIRPLAVAETLEQAAAVAGEALRAHGDCDSAARHPLRVLSVGSGAARAPSERFLRQRLQQLGLGSRPEPGLPRLWCIQRQAAGGRQGQQGQQGQRAEVLLGLEAAPGAPPTAAEAAALRRLGPTAMRPELAALSACLAALPPGALVLDPFCGTGSLLSAALLRGAALGVGSDIDSTHFPSSPSAPPTSDSSSGGHSLQVFLQADAASLQSLLPQAAADAIITDLPYGFRTASTTAAAVDGSEAVPAAAGGREAGSDGEPHGWQSLLAVLLRLAAHALASRGRLVAWMPRQGGGDEAGEEACTSQQREHLAALGLQQRPALCLLHFLPESRQAGYPRAVAVFEREPDAKECCDGTQQADRQAAMLETLHSAKRAGLPVLGLTPPHRQPESAQQQPPGEQQQQPDATGAAAGRQRGVRYSLARSAAVGAAIDVWRAAWLGDTAAISQFAAAGGGVDARDHKGQTALQFAAGYGRTAAVELLLRLGADPSAAADSAGMPALHRAAARNHAGAVAALLAAGADAWQPSAPAPASGKAAALGGQTAAMLAAQFGHGRTLQLLLRHLGASDGPAVEGAAGSPGAGGRSLRRHLALTDAAGLTALHLAAQWGMAEAARLLLQAGADPNQPSACPRGLAPAHLAARWGHADVLAELRRHSADLQLPCAQGWTPLREAVEWRRPTCVALLRALEAGQHDCAAA